MSINTNISKVLRFSALGEKSDLCRISAEIYKQILDYSLTKRRLVISEIDLHTKTVSLKIRGDNAFISQKQSLKDLIYDVIKILNREGAFRFLKYFLRIVYASGVLKIQPKTEIGYTIIARMITGLFFEGKIFPAYAVWLTSNISEMKDYVLQEDIKGEKAPPTKDRHEYFLRNEISKTMSYEDYLKKRKKNNKEYYDIELTLRRNAVRETLHELYFMAGTVSPKLNTKKIEFVRNPPESVSFIALRKGHKKICHQEWSMSKYISKGAEGSVYRACCGNDCGYVMKIVNKDPADFEFRESCNREKMMWEEFMKIGLAPRLLETYIEDSYESVPSYCVFLCEEMDISAQKIVDKILKKKDGGLLWRFYRLIFKIIERAHKYNLFHADSHLDNFMLKARDKRIYNNLDSLLNELEKENGEVVMTYIDFGDSVSYELSKKEILRTLDIARITPRLIELGCLNEVKTRLTVDKIFRAIMYYDYYLAGQDILLEGNDEIKEVRKIKKLFLNRMNSLKTRCFLTELKE
jgi:hypothetical protein